MVETQEQERALRSHEHLALITNTVPALISYLDTDCRYQFCNAAYEDWFGLRQDELIGHHVCEVLGAEACETLLPRVEAALRGETQEFETEAKYAHGPRRWIHAVYRPHHDHAGRVIGLVVMVLDITARKQAEAALLRNQQLIDKALSIETVGILFFDLRGSITHANPAFERMSGYTREELKKFDWHMLTAPDFFEAMARTVHNLATNGETPPYEKQMIRKNGSRWWGLFAPTRLSGDGEDSYCIEFILDISERKETEQRLEEQARLLNLSNDAIMVRDSENRVTYWNKGAQEIYGYSAAEVLGKNKYEVLRTEFTTPLSEIFASLEREDRWQGELIHTDKNGRRLNIFSRWSVDRDAKGRIRSILETTNDITAHKATEEALRETEERFRQLAENIPQLAWMADADGWIFWYNRRWFEYTGTTLEEMQGWGWQKVHHPDLVDGVVNKFKKALETGQNWEDTFPLRGKDGQYRWFLSRAFPIHDATGKIVRWFGTNTDITELRETQRALAEREAVLRSVAREARVGLVMVDKNRRYIFANHRHAEILGVPAGNFEGLHIQEILGELYEQIKPNLDRAFEGERITYEIRIPRHPVTGGQRFAEISYEPRLDDSHDPYVVVVMSDITDRKLMQQNLERMVAERTMELRETNEHLEAFVYSIAHDLRAPLRAMQGYSQILMDNAAEHLPQPDRMFLEKINRSAEFMDKMVLDLLAFGRTASTEITFGPVNLRSVWDSAVEQTSDEIQRANAILEVATPLCIVRAHEPTLTQVLANLLSNAIKFVEAGTRPRVQFGCEERGRIVHLWLQDNGVGIDPEYHERVFRVFERLHGTRFAGTGIGLAIVRKGVDRMNGKIGIESTPGKGTCFWIELPKA